MGSQLQRSARVAFAIWSQLFLRAGSSAGVLVVGGYFVYLRDHGTNVNSLLLGGLSGIVYVTELIGAPIAGSFSDRRGRRIFLLAGPALSAVAVLLIPLGSTDKALLTTGSIVGVVAAARLLEGVGAALSVPATLGLLAETTDDLPARRGRTMGFFELASALGIAAGAALGPLLWEKFHLVAFVVLAGLYAIAALLVLGIREKPRSRSTNIAFSLRRYAHMLSYRPLALFIPTWIAVNAILGVWVNAQIEFVLTAHLHVPGQQFVGSLHGRSGTLSAILGAYVLWFAVCVVVWAVVLSRFPRLPTLIVTVLGSVLASVGLIALNHHYSPLAFVPLVLVGVFLEAGFTPTALAYLADISQAFARDRGLLMGLYSVMLGIGQLIGAVLGGLFAQFAYFDGLAYLTVLLAFTALGPLVVTMMVRRPMGRGRRTASEDVPERQA